MIPLMYHIDTIFREIVLFPLVLTIVYSCFLMHIASFLHLIWGYHDYNTQKSIPTTLVVGLYFFGRNPLRKLTTSVVRGFHFWRACC